ncbi:MAG TPA: ATP-dependent Clp protease ATP-binding subunit, partial [Ktedonobacteraceae bacterium]|nr:ATP-dependent Clp protease ATP-binding subunit [Ktedonobacteraceae bacterium]
AVSRDLTRAALEGKLRPLVGREVELERTMQILARKSKNNPVLLGPAGVGKTAIAEGLALRIVQEQVPDNLLGCRVVSLETGLLTVGTKFRGDFEERLQAIMQEIVKTPGIIIVIDELHTLMSSGVSEGSMDAANLFKPLLARGEFRCIGATTPEDYRHIIESDPALERRFQPVSVEETSTLETLDILRGLRGHYADFHQLAITDQALVAAVTLSSRYIQSRFQPDKALDVLDEAAARVRVQYAQPSPEILQMRDEIVAVRREKDYTIARHDFPQALALLKRERALNLALDQAEQDWRANREQQQPTVREQDIAAVVERWTGIPLARIVSDEAQQLLNLEDDLHRRVVGQHEAVQAVAKAVRRSRTDIRDGRRPIGSFLFVGPSGVGKTELAHALASSLFGDERALLKLDMSEFMESHHVSRLIGSPPGYLGYDQPGQLTEAVRRRPYSIVLFDEIEKAHPKIFDLLLQILEEGRLTDARGQSVDFRHTIVILTSNAGTEHTLSNNIAFTTDRLRRAEHITGIQERTRSRVMVAVKDILRPELFNRIDEIVVFHALRQEHLYVIADLMLAQTRQRLAALSIELQVTEAARTFLVKSAYSPAGGARHLRHTIQRLLEDMLATGLLNNSFAANDSVVVDVIDGSLNAHKLEEKSMVAVVGTHNQDAA